MDVVFDKICALGALNRKPVLQSKLIVNSALYRLSMVERVKHLNFYSCGLPAFGSSDTNTIVTCCDEKESTAR